MFNCSTCGNTSFSSISFLRGRTVDSSHQARLKVNTGDVWVCWAPLSCFETQELPLNWEDPPSRLSRPLSSRRCLQEARTEVKLRRLKEDKLWVILQSFVNMHMDVLVLLALNALLAFFALHVFLVLIYRSNSRLYHQEFWYFVAVRHKSLQAWKCHQSETSIDWVQNVLIHLCLQAQSDPIEQDHPRWI